MDRPTLLQQLPAALLGGGTSLRAADRRLAWLDSTILLVAGLALFALGQVDTARGLHPFGVDADSLPAWTHLVLLALACGALVLKRRMPLLVMGVAAVCLCVDLVLGGSVAMIIVLWDALFATQLHGSPVTRRITAVGVVLAIAAAVIASAAATTDPRTPATLALTLFAIVVTPMWWGSNVRQGSELADAADDRARLERERSAALLRLADAQQHDAVRAERSAVARDLHDVVASHLSAIALTSSAALAGEPDPERDRAALRSVRAESLASLDDMRAMIRVLRSDGDPDQPDEDLTAASRTANLGPVLEQARLAGLTLRVEDPGGLIDGTDHALPVAVDHAVYRIVRESLTNVLKHGGGRTLLRLRHGDDLEVEVSDEGSQESRGETSTGTGTGLVSMRERAEALGGTFEAGPDGTGWRVRAILPMPTPAISTAGPETGETT
ncbi:signal transduction histidine kinase [Nocardioides luteus]|uniref:histidine kinase n=1 Tax=Nocardioides luteus TaxID=1844 RepID=A0ABQ5T2J3_9ACTN|nr:histidine kinase [Nocardioides luteus]MDR7311448.1 signal transduction histidine kinase [Nocardioides luteus]GGR55528.1 two-component sensor histidine kinase [Nocardioides luteus]GLJ70098.1 two-component sensor histidine kinase [Nocardioides luteus]